MYRPIKFTESSHAYSFPKQADDGNVLKGATLPGPQSYNQVGMADLNHRACRILGGKLGKTVEEQRKEKKMLKNMPESERAPDFPPGPAAYNINPIHNIPGFVIKQPESKVIANEKNKAAAVGP